MPSPRLDSQHTALVTDATDMIRILHVIPSLRRGGAEQQLASLVSNTSPDQFQHVVCHLSQPDTLAGAIERAGGLVVGLNLDGHRPWLRAAQRVGDLARSIAPDIVQTWLYDASLSARLSRAQARGIPQITSLQSPDYEPETIRGGRWPRWKMTGLRWLDVMSARWTAPTFVACSEFVAQSARRRLGVPEPRMLVIYNSIDPDTLRCETGEPERVRAEVGISHDSILFLNVGRLDPQKGQSELVRAFRAVAAAAPQTHLAILGDGALTAELRAQARALGIEDRVRVLEHRTDVGAWLEAADVFVFPSRFEGLPLALVEAMFKGLPCIASDIGPHREVIRSEETGTLVPAGDVNALAQAMLGLCNDAERRRALGTRAREAAERFHIRAIVPQWERLYRQLLSG